MGEENHIVDRVFQHRWLPHFLFWVVFLLMAPFTSDRGLEKAGEAFLIRTIALPTKMMATYLLVYYQIPQLLQKKKYLEFILSFVVSVVVFTILARYTTIHIAERLTDPDEVPESLGQIIREYEFTLGYFGRIYPLAFLFLFFKMIKDRGIEKQKIEILKQEKANAELNFLKAQIHPHFLFNTLNNLYALTLEKSDEAPEVVAKLAEMLDYMLYRCQDEKVPISQEIALLEHYTDLEKLRYGDRLTLNFTYSVDNPQTPIAPLILISIVENAFKHGVSSVVGPAAVSISLEVLNGRLDFNVINSKPIATEADPMNYKKGIGVQNAQRQLDLLYPNQYAWRTEEHAETYEVHLSL
ncbi:sensor histidine kinase [Tunicatimonas pelagia]|uniref:sensor histidine kinase n=1 Tax=Tunicatimonas pelagia TaxID=931531 RepID=UPI00266682F6|nr:sensor histidine kinase [Tunicatimonas pelagia]WKN43348.1 sensor histidine kinase [Tunicatimonas pelagia]